MNVSFFSDSNSDLQVGDLATGFVNQKDLEALVVLPNEISQEALFREFKKFNCLLYVVAKVVQWQFLWISVHYCFVRKVSDGKEFKIHLTDPAFDWSSVKYPTHDPRSDWLKLATMN